MNRREKVLESLPRAEHVSSTLPRVADNLAEREVLETMHATLQRLTPHLLVSKSTIISVLGERGREYLVTQPQADL